MPNNEHIDSDKSKEIESLKIENLRLELDLKFREHEAAVEKQMTVGKFKLGAAGAVVIFLAWYGTYQQWQSEIKGQVEKRLEKEFSAENVKLLIRQSSEDAARKEIQKEKSVDTDHNRFKCAINRQGKDLFESRCRADGGKMDDSRNNVCLEANGKEISYAPPFSNIDCEKILGARSTEISP